MSDDWKKGQDASKNLQEQFAKASAAKQQQQQQQQSEMVKNDRPQMQPKPPSNTREGADRQSYNERLAYERAAAQRNAAINARKQQEQQQQKEQGKNNDDRSR